VPRTGAEYSKALSPASNYAIRLVPCGGPQNGPMEALVYVDRSDIRPGMADQLEAAARQLVEHVAAHEPRALSYGIHFSEDRSAMTVVHVHPDSESLQELLGLIAPVLAPFRDLLQLRSIDVYGSPSDAVLQLLRAKVDLLGGTVNVHRRVAGVEGGLFATAASASR
jgi:hypothetical protein